MTNNNLHERILKISLTIFVSIICLCIVTTTPAQSKKEKSTQSATDTASKNSRPQRTTPPQIKRNSPRVAKPRGTTTTKPTTSTTTPKSKSKPELKPTPTKTQPSKNTATESIAPKLAPRESVVASGKKSVDSTPKRADVKLPTFRRSNQSITASGKVTTKKTPPRTAETNKTVTTKPQTATATTANTKSTNTQSANTKSANTDTQRDRVSDLLRRLNPNTKNSRSDNAANNRNENNRNANNRVIAPSPSRVGGLRLPARNAEVARSIADSNRRKSPPSYRHQPSPSTIKNVRKNFRGYNDYWTGDWYRRHPDSWRPAAIHKHNWWHRPHWRDTYDWFDAAFFAGVFLNGMLNTHNYYPYYYGNNIVYSGDMVYVNGVPYVSSAEYYRQALELAGTAEALVKAEAEKTPEVIIVNQPVPAPPQPAQKQPQQVDDGWLPMGTFAFVDVENEKENVNNTPNVSQEILQIAANKTGQIRGNFVDEKTILSGK